MIVCFWKRFWHGIGIYLFCKADHDHVFDQIEINCCIPFVSLLLYSCCLTFKLSSEIQKWNLYIYIVYVSLIKHNEDKWILLSNTEPMFRLGISYREIKICVLVHSFLNKLRNWSFRNAENIISIISIRLSADDNSLIRDCK